MSIVYDRWGVTVHHGDALNVLPTLPAESVHAVVCDPPYGLEFMGKDWDAPWKRGDDINADAGFTTEMRAFQDWCQQWAVECLRVLKPGGHLLGFGGTRTAHRLASAIEDAGFEVRDSIAWLYGGGFPKSHDVSKAIDKAAGAQREVVGMRAKVDSYGPAAGNKVYGSGADHGGIQEITDPATDAARQWEGWGTALKPAHEPIVVARKPLVGTVARTVSEHGTGALNIDGCRVATTDDLNGGGDFQQLWGRWPANVVLDPDAAAEVDLQSGVAKSKASVGRQTAKHGTPALGDFDDSGGASRFFPVFRWEAKAPAAERPQVNGTAHPTVKPISLMRWLVRLVTPPGGTVCDPFLGSGTTAQACRAEGMKCIGIELADDYLPLIRARLDAAPKTDSGARPVEGDAPMDLLGLLDESHQ